MAKVLLRTPRAVARALRCQIAALGGHCELVISYSAALRLPRGMEMLQHSRCCLFLLHMYSVTAVQVGDAHQVSDEQGLKSSEGKLLDRGGSPTKASSGRGRGGWSKWWAKKGARESPEPRPGPARQPTKEKREKSGRDKSPKKGQKPPPSDHPLPGQPKPGPLPSGCCTFDCQCLQ